MVDDVVAELTGARLAFGDRVLWDHLDLTVRAGEFIAVLGPNGTGKTSLLKVLLGQLPLSAGTATVAGGRIEAGSERIGYVPQHRSLDRGLSIRGRDLVGLGYDGHRWGLTSLRGRSAKRDAVQRALDQVNGLQLGHVPVGVMSGGEMQRIRIAQALAADPVLLLCDEPLLNLDPANARLVSALIDQRRRESDTAVLFVTHEVNPVLPYVDRVLYLVEGRFRVGTVEEVMTSATLSELYRAEIQVVKVAGDTLWSASTSTTPGTQLGTTMTERLTDLLANLFAFNVTVDLLHRDFVQQALLAAALLALVSGLIGPFIVMRQMSFAVHGSSELSLTGASFALLAGFNVGIGALVGCGLAAVLFGILGQRARERDSAIGVVLAFGLGLAVLFIHLYPGRTGTSFALLTGQIVGVGYSGLALLAVVVVLVVAVLTVCFRPLLFATVDPEVAAGRGVPVRALGIVFAALVGVTAAQGVQIVGALLVMSLLITPAAAAARVFVSPAATIAASVVFAEISAVGGILLSLAPGVPVSVFVTTISFAIYLVCWLVGRRNRVSSPG